MIFHDKLTLLATMAQHPDAIWDIGSVEYPSLFSRCYRHLPDLELRWYEDGVHANRTALSLCVQCYAEHKYAVVVNPRDPV